MLRAPPDDMRPACVTACAAFADTCAVRVSVTRGDGDTAPARADTRRARDDMRRAHVWRRRVTRAEPQSCPVAVTSLSCSAKGSSLVYE